jgi:hypothetical protein
VALGGTLDISLINGFMPVLGDTFGVVTFASSSGAFAALNGAHLGNGLVLVPASTGTNVTLVAANEANVSTPAPEESGYKFNFASTTGFSYVVEYTGSLQPPASWLVLTNLAGNGSLVAVVDPTPTVAQRYYRVRFK